MRKHSLLLCLVGIHGRAWNGTGCMGDGHRCVDCGADTYGPMVALRWKELDRLTPENEDLSDSDRWEKAK